MCADVSSLMSKLYIHDPAFHVPNQMSSNYQKMKDFPDYHIKLETIIFIVNFPSWLRGTVMPESVNINTYRIKHTATLHKRMLKKDLNTFQDCEVR